MKMTMKWRDGSINRKYVMMIMNNINNEIMKAYEEEQWKRRQW